MTTEAPPQRRLVSGGDPDARYPIPDEEAFFDGETERWHDFLDDAALSEIGAKIIREKLTHLDDGEFTCDFKWKRKGGTSKGHAMLGNCVKLAGAARHYANSTTALVYLASDHCYGFTRWQVEALIYHELLKVDREEKFKTEKVIGKDGVLREEERQLPTVYHLTMPDVSFFYQEIKEYGLWLDSFAQLPEVIQSALPGFERSDAEIANSPSVQRAARNLVKSTMRPGGGIDSVTFSTPENGHSVTLTREDADRIRRDDRASK